ncbi:serine/threonine-protein kinase rio2 isoform X1 [Prunus avium]|uniref:Serine/threonine-protein kinase RIO2 n=1 Tax=Prunus avium TaxID=42229 RepID=A0A6P5U0Y9_PRUAV|nr:serine/threonine-protein kinase rio2 isoform X1 [Prunus avium]
MKLDVNMLRYLSKEDFRVLTAVEMGMRNHEIVPCELVERIASLKHGGTYKVLKNLLKHKLLHHDSSKYDGFRLTYLGYDFLAIKTLVNRGVFVSVGRQIGVGKESDIFEVATEDGTVMAMKLHRLGRVSFRAVKSKRDYLKHRSSFSWLYLSRLAALKEFAFMKALEEHGFPVPNAVDCNRHCVIMSLVQGYPFVQVKQLQNPEVVFETIIGLVVRLAEHGLIHCDFNEFNIMIDDDERVTMIDFPQMVSVSHHNAQMYFDRDVECVFKFFKKRFNMSFQECTDDIDGTEVDTDSSGRPCFSSIAKDAVFLDKELAASGFTKKDQEVVEKFIEGGLEKDASSDDEGTGDGTHISEEDASSDDEDFEDATHISVLNEANIKGVDSLHLLDQGQTLNSKHEEEGVGNNLRNCEVGPSSKPESQDVSDKEGDDEAANDDDAELEKRLSKVRRRAVTAARGRRKNLASRNTYKDKGGRSSQSSKVQSQLGSW